MFALDDILLADNEDDDASISPTRFTYKIEFGIVDGEIRVANGIVQHVVTVLERGTGRARE